MLTFAANDPLLLLCAAFALDLVLGDPAYRLHPVRLLGDACLLHERWLRALGLGGYTGGILHWLLMQSTALGAWWGLRCVATMWHPWAAFAVDLLLAWQLLCLRDLLDHGRRVLRAIPADDEAPLDEARQAVGMLVGRDTERMDRGGVVRATVESLSENLTDGVLTPLWAFTLGGLPALIVVKVISTLDSMVGYRNQRYRRFGWAGARSDDLIHWLPARLSVPLIAASGLFVGGHPGSALSCAWREHGRLESPNSGWSEAAIAGALRLRLLGPIYKNGQLVNETWMGPQSWSTPSDGTALRRALWLIGISGVVAWGLGILAHLLIYA